jgi:hypothetical protein
VERQFAPLHGDAGAVQFVLSGLGPGLLFMTAGALVLVVAILQNGAGVQDSTTDRLALFAWELKRWSRENLPPVPSWPFAERDREEVRS